jgi:chromodomain-helicase-DNA-binding protein 7
LPPRLETLVEIDLTMVQKQYYKAIYEKNVDMLMQQVRHAAHAQGCLIL